MEMLTPLVRAVEGTPVIVRLSNTSRDAYKGVLRLDDSLVSPERPVSFCRPGGVSLDTLVLQNTSAPAGR